MTPSEISSPFWLYIRRGMMGKCPHCGEGHLFTAYLKQTKSCILCHETYGHIHADDAPAWMTILIVGHILAPLIIYMIMNTAWADWVYMIFFTILILILTFSILPRAKGFFIAMIWHQNRINRT